MDTDQNSLAPVKDMYEPAEPHPGSITEYNDAINYMSGIIDGIRDHEQQDDNQRQDQHPSVRLEEADPIESGLGAADPSPCQTVVLDPETMCDASQEDTAALSDANSIPGTGRVYDHHRNILSDLRKAAFLVTNTSLELSDCANFGRRAYWLVLLGLAGCVFSTVCVLISPDHKSLGFAAAAAALSGSCVFGLAYLVCFRTFVAKASAVHNSLVDGTESESPVV